MALLDVMNEVTATKKEKKAADKKYVTFTLEEWAKMEAAHGKAIQPNDIKSIVVGVFEGRFNISVPKPKA